MRYLAPIPSQFLDENGEPYYGGMVHVYVHGEMRHAEIYQNAQTDELAQNPFPLDSHGSWQAFVDADKTFDYIVKDSGGNVVARFPEITFPTGEGVPEVSVVSPDGSINVNEVVDETGKMFEIEVNRDILEPSYSEFSHDTVNGNGGAAVLDSFTLEIDADADIYLTEGVLTFKKGLYHVSMNLVIGNSVESGAYYDIVVNFGGNELKKTWDGSFVHEESVELGMDVTADQDGHTVIPSIVELPEGMYCRVSRLDVHKVGGAGVGGSGAPIEHDGSLEGDGTHGNPLGVKAYSEIRTDLAEVIEGLDTHKTDPSAHQDIRDELERKEDKDNKVTSWGSTPSDEKYPSEKLVKDTIDNIPPGTAVKGDAESEYRTGNVNLTPANIGAATAAQGANADTAVQGVKVNGTELSKDGNNKVDVPVPTAFAATPLKDGTASAGSSSQWARGDHVHPTDDSREAVNNKKQVVNDSSTTEYPSSKAVADFVNSSVATNTATFLGNFKLPDLGLAYPATEVQIAAALNSHTWPTGFPTNNDYVYVEIQDPQSTIDDKVQRYKYRDVLASWGYEYTLNNSSFTAEEKAAIDSGITSQDVTNLRADHTTLDTHIADTSNPHNVTKSQVGLGNVDNTSDANKPVSTAQQTALNAKQDTISDLTTIRSGAYAGASALQPSGNGSNLSVTPDGSSTGYDIGSSTTLKVFAQKFKNLVGALKALAFKDKASYNDLSSGVQSSLDKADSALQSHQSVTDNNPTLYWNTTSKVGKVGSTDLRVTMPANPAQNLPASVITSGTFGTDRIADDAITAAKVKDNETLPVNISGSASLSKTIYEDGSAGGKSQVHIFGTENTNNSMAGWRKIATITKLSNSYSSARICGKIFASGGNWGELPNYEIDFQIRVNFTDGNYFIYHNPSANIQSLLRLVEVSPNSVYEVQVQPQGLSPFSNFWVYIWHDHFTYAWSIAWNDDLSVAGSAGTVITNYKLDVRKFRLANGPVGSPTTPVYVDSDGQVQQCTQGATLKSNTATLYIAGYTDNNIPIYNVKDIKNGCVNHVDFSNIASANCNITFEAPTLAAGEEYDYIISLEGYTNNTGVSTGSYVENCKQVLRYDYNSNLWVGEGLFLQATDWRQICVVRGNTCEWKRVALS